MGLCALAAPAAILAQAPAVALLQEQQNVLQTLGSPTAEWSPALCPTRHIALYQQRHAMLKLVFDEQQRLTAFSLMAKRPGREGRWPRIVWPGVANGIAAPRPYANDSRLAPWFYNLSPKEWSYYEVQRDAATQGQRRYLGSVVLDNAGSFASGRAFPSTLAGIATQAPFRGQAVDRTPQFQPLRAWRSRTLPNVLMEVALESAAVSAACSGFSLSRLDFSDINRR